MRFKKITGMLLCVTLSAGILTGCTKFHTADPEDGYATMFSLSPTEYAIFVSEQTSTAANILYTRFVMASRVLDGSYPWEDEAANAEEAVSKMQEVVDNVTTTMPPQTYESDRQSFLDQLEQAKTYLDDYKTHLETRDSVGITSDISLLESAFLALGGESYAVYK